MITFSQIGNNEAFESNKKNIDKAFLYIFLTKPSHMLTINQEKTNDQNTDMRPVDRQIEYTTWYWRQTIK